MRGRGRVGMAETGNPKELGAEASSRESLAPALVAARDAEIVETARATARRALELAGSLIAPNADAATDRKMAAVLLREAAIATGRTVARGAVRSCEEAAFVLRGALAPEPDEAALLALVRLDTETLPSADELYAVERLLRGVLEPTPRPRVVRRVALGLTVVSIAGAVLVSKLRAEPPWANAEWKASSAHPGFAASGRLGATSRGRLLFHTGLEERPSLTIDLLEVRTINRIVIANRRDCCFERCLPLLVEAGASIRELTRVGRRTELFDVWDVEFAARAVRYVRLLAEARTYLHLEAVEIS